MTELVDVADLKSAAPKPGVRVRFPFLGPNQNPEPILAVRDFFNDFSKILCGACGPGILAEVTAAQQGQEISDFLWDLIRNE